MTAAPASSDVSGDGSKIKINVWLTDPASWATNEADVAVSAAAEFNEAHPEYQIEIDNHDFRTMPAEVARAAEQGEQPDIAEYHYTVTRAAMDSLGRDRKPLYTPVERAVAGRTEILGEPVVLGDMVPAARDYFRYAGELVAMPRTASGLVLYSNMDLLAKAGVAEPPRTWREVSAACQALAKLPGGPPHGITWPNFYWIFLQSVAQQGGLIADRDNGRSGRAEKVDLASTEMMAYVTWWQRLHQDGHYLYTGKLLDFESCYAAFEEQRLAMFLSSSVDASHLLKRGERHGFTVKVSPMPYNDEVRFAGNMMGGFSLWLAAGLSQAKQDGALAFMQYLNRPRAAAEWARRHYRVPISRGRSTSWTGRAGTATTRTFAWPAPSSRRRTAHRRRSGRSSAGRPASWARSPPRCTTSWPTGPSREPGSPRRANGRSGSSTTTTRTATGLPAARPATLPSACSRCRSTTVSSAYPGNRASGPGPPRTRSCTPWASARGSATRCGSWSSPPRTARVSSRRCCPPTAW
ncbi:hypothetical protein Psuf_070630 [Phytohabitans suffuscus]|uniref:Extracellular solute-binding protein n=1 Tax=Phytohabitans suffuscus TaxID=624315 RepID=A0A6F8YUC5_9ACTN|nr:extracellular solute-binding protein [Phytohabitans suffuscus]BCB89750.1 hypothetical protein Psuf_070630 [Phytohabitans suffuscus]